MTTPSREDALNAADQMVSEWTEQVKNQRGYVHDKWSPVELEARTVATLKIALFLLTPTGPLVAPATHTHCIDPESGCSIREGTQ